MRSLSGSRTFLVTGATGFVGGAVVVAALREGLGPSLCLMARSGPAGDARTRLLENLRRLGASRTQLNSLGEDFVLDGDLAEPHLFATHPLLRHVERAVHAAALPTFSNNPSIPLINVDGTVALAHALNNSGKLKRFVFVGTAMAVGAMQERGSTIAESKELGCAQDHLVPYTASKAEAERRLRTEIPGLPLVIARPSIVVGHTTLGVSPSQSIFWVFLVGQMLGAFTCGLNDVIDVIPADWCADALLKLATQERLKHDIYHISAGSESSRSIRSLDLKMAAARKIAPMAAGYRKIAGCDLKSLLPKLREIAPTANKRLLLRAMQLYGGFAELNYVFDNGRIKSEGLRTPPPLTSYIGHCVETARGIPIAEQMKWDFK